MIEALTALTALKDTLSSEYWRKWQYTSAPTLYHYTTAIGLRGIIESRELWLSDAAYLNDSTEAREATRIVRDVVVSQAKLLAESPVLDYFKILIETFDKALEGLSQQRATNHYVGCFSLDRDSLSQWRAYGGGEGGFAIGFDADEIWRIKSSFELKPGYWLLPCEYDEAHCSTLLRNYFAGVAEIVARDGVTESLVFQSLAQISWLSAAVKNRAFLSEQEWRLVRFDPEGDHLSDL